MSQIYKNIIISLLNFHHILMLMLIFKIIALKVTDVNNLSLYIGAQKSTFLTQKRYIFRHNFSCSFTSRFQGHEKINKVMNTSRHFDMIKCKQFSQIDRDERIFSIEKVLQNRNLRANEQFGNKNKLNGIQVLISLVFLV